MCVCVFAKVNIHEAFFAVAANYVPPTDQVIVYVMYRVGQTSKLLILSKYVNKTEKIG